MARRWLSRGTGSSLIITKHNNHQRSDVTDSFQVVFGSVVVTEPKSACAASSGIRTSHLGLP